MGVKDHQQLVLRCTVDHRHGLWWTRCTNQRRVGLVVDQAHARAGRGMGAWLPLLAGDEVARWGSAAVCRGSNGLLGLYVGFSGHGRGKKVVP